MHFHITLKTLGMLTIFLAIFMTTPLIVAFAYSEPTMPIIYSVLTTLLIGGILLIFSYKKDNIEIGIKDGFLIVSIGWLLAGIVGGLPYLFYDVFGPVNHESVVNAIFESVSGFTTTGASVINDIEALPKALLFWRSLTHWLGGMGIILLSIAVLPLLGVGGMQLFKAEVPGPVAEKLKPRISETALILWNVYVLISLFEVLFLMLGGMNLFEAVCHMFGTMATGGFSTKNKSIAAYDSSYIHWVITIFMIIAGANFALHYSALKGNLKTFFKDTEFKVYFTFLAILITIGTVIHYFSIEGTTLSISLRDVAFQVASILTTTGYITANYELWPYVLQVILFILMFIGGCAGSTGGSVKFMRYIVIFKHTYREIIKQIHPKAIISIQFNKKPISDNVTKAVWCFFFCFILFFIFGTIIMASLGQDLLSSSAAAIACLGNVGPGFGTVGPVKNYSELHLVAKAVLTFLMIVGRLEVFTILLLFIPNFWRK